ncbi:MAG TPA: SDR family oxidoreductase [Gaiellaceae bacterium]|nr:SDR family oxidoreductase [Gaiellaceae bacterium]
MGRLDGRVALVTGAAHERGIGRGIVRELAAEGAVVAVVDIAHEGMGEKLAAEVGGRFYRADVADRPSVDALVEQVERDLGPLDVVASNAGVADWHAFTDVTDDSFDRIVAVNLTGAFNVGQASARAMVRSGRPGRIVFTSSVHVQMPFPTMSVYGATKQGVRALCEAMAIELAPHGIRVNHIGPGWVLSQLNDPSPAVADPEELRKSLATIPIEQRPADPRELGRAVVYFASADGDYVTGEYLRVDGGFVVGVFP